MFTGVFIEAIAGSAHLLPYTPAQVSWLFLLTGLHG